MYKLFVILHLLGAAVWVGGHLVLCLAVLPPALRARDPAPIRAFEERFERLGIPALLLQIVSGLWLAHYWVPDWKQWLGGGGPQSGLLATKFVLLALTAALGVHARLALIPRLDAATLPKLGLHIVGVTLLAVAFLVAGAGIRLGGLS